MFGSRKRKRDDKEDDQEEKNDIVVQYGKEIKHFSYTEIGNLTISSFKEMVQKEFGLVPGFTLIGIPKSKNNDQDVQLTSLFLPDKRRKLSVIGTKQTDQVTFEKSENELEAKTEERDDLTERVLESRRITQEQNEELERERRSNSLNSVGFFKCYKPQYIRSHLDQVLSLEEENISELETIIEVHNFNVAHAWSVVGSCIKFHKLKSLKYLVKKGLPLALHDLATAAAYARFEFLNYFLNEQKLDEGPQPKDESIVERAVQCGHLNVVEYLYEHRFYPLTQRSIKVAVDFAHLPIIKFIYFFKFQRDQKNTTHRISTDSK